MIIKKITTIRLKFFKLNLLDNRATRHNRCPQRQTTTQLNQMFIQRDYVYRKSGWQSSA